MTLGQSIPVLGDWFIIHFTENYGMAFGLEFSGEYGKLILSVFRIVAVLFIGWYLYRLIRKNASPGLIACISLIMAGAIGNIIDSAFYGLIFSESLFNQVAEFMPEAGGYGSFLHGKVVDLFYFPIIRGTFPSWMPFWGDQQFLFFRPVFNVADSAITLGVFWLIIFQKKYFSHQNNSNSLLPEPKNGEQKPDTVNALPTPDRAQEAISLDSIDKDEDNRGFLFEQIIFGPVKSRRLGISLGVNLLPLNIKHCSFNCLYCECGWTKAHLAQGKKLHAKEDVRDALDMKLSSMRDAQKPVDTITFAGNGEPTLHPDFAAIIDDAIILRDKYFPSARIAVLSNASLAGNKEVASALMKIEQNILKLDAGTEESFQTINNPSFNITLSQVIENLKQFRGQMIIQTLFVRGTYAGKHFDNTTEKEVSAWLNHIDSLKPKLVMIYPIARATPADHVEKVEDETLRSIAKRVEALGVQTEVYL